MTQFSGVWLPIITPFANGSIDYAGYELLLEHYVRAGVTGIVPLGTTGESPTIDAAEAETLIERTVASVRGRVPVLVGVGGNDTRKVVNAVKRLQRHDVQGILSVCPYYNRPSQDGMREHFSRVAEATDRPILIYNIPYRTGINLSNNTLLDLARIPNIMGVKDSSGNIAQSLELLRERPAGFAVLTGEDAYFYTMLAHGGDGGILASAHINTAAFLTVYRQMSENNYQGALKEWASVERIIPLLFTEPNPTPIKYLLWRQGLIASAECRLPLTRISEALALELDAISESMATAS
jgi:4-hydroxy-tetrahydrodipicolinate synthase